MKQRLGMSPFLALINNRVRGHVAEPTSGLSSFADQNLVFSSGKDRGMHGGRGNSRYRQLQSKKAIVRLPIYSAP